MQEPFFLDSDRKRWVHNVPLRSPVHKERLLTFKLKCPPPPAINVTCTQTAVCTCMRSMDGTSYNCSRQPASSCVRYVTKYNNSMIRLLWTTPFLDINKTMPYTNVCSMFPSYSTPGSYSGSASYSSQQSAAECNRCTAYTKHPDLTL